MSIVPDLNSFKSLARDANTIPVYREVAADLDTPVSAFMKLQSGGEGFLLESVEGGERWGRFSVLGADPLMTLRCVGGKLSIRRRDGGSSEVTGEPLEALAQVLSPFRQAEVAGLSRFGGGFVGYFAYDIVRHFETLPETCTDDLEVADFAGLVADNFVLFDNVSHTMKVVSLAVLDEHQSVEEAYQAAVDAVDSTVDLLAKRPVELPQPSAPAEGGVVCNRTKDDYAGAVEAAREYIRAGDIIQVVLSQRFSQPLATHPFSIYRALRAINPSPYMFYLDLGDEILVGASPEMMVKVEGRTVSVRPIAGTIRKGANEEEDRRLVAEMMADPKERAEHIMLLDLGRNDVGRVAEIGSVKVLEQMVVESYSHVHHIVSHVEGRLEEGKDCYDAFRATFPAGTLSGAPKIRAMEIIEELEPTRRGVYGGAVGYLDFKGNLDTCIAIRTVLIKGGAVHLQVGAGIVADSDPAREQAECEAKAEGAAQALVRAMTIEAR